MQQKGQDKHTYFSVYASMHCWHSHISLHVIARFFFPWFQYVSIHPFPKKKLIRLLLNLPIFPLKRFFSMNLPNQIRRRVASGVSSIQRCTKRSKLWAQGLHTKSTKGAWDTWGFRQQLLLCSTCVGCCFLLLDCPKWHKHKHWIWIRFGYITKKGKRSKEYNSHQDHATFGVMSPLLAGQNKAGVTTRKPHL